MKREFTLDIDGQQVTVSAERDGDTIRVGRDGASFAVRVLAESLVGIQSAAQAPTGSGTPQVAGGTAPAPRPAAAPKPAPAPASGGGQGGGDAGSGAAGAVNSPMTGVIDQVLVTEGATVAAGDKIVILEAMKMFIDVMAPVAGTVSAVSVAPGDSVREGQAILTIDPAGDGG